MQLDVSMSKTEKLQRGTLGYGGVDAATGEGGLDAATGEVSPRKCPQSYNHQRCAAPSAAEASRATPLDSN